jgi:WD40 repeat protein
MRAPFIGTVRAWMRFEMNNWKIVQALASILVAWSELWANAQPAAPSAPARAPVLRLEPGGPTSYVATLVFSPDGNTLFEAGFDKTVRVWTVNDQRKFVLSREAYRVPIGAGQFGSINAIAVSGDGRWLAAGGSGAVRGAGDQEQTGIVLPQIGGMTEEMRLDKGTIFLFDRHTQRVRSLRGHRGDVVALTFAPRRANKAALLVSAGREQDDPEHPAGYIRVWDTSKADAPICSPKIALTTSMFNSQPGLTARHSDSGVDQLEVAIAWDDGTLRFWNVEKGAITEVNDGKYNVTAAYLADGKHILTGSYIGKDGRLRMWDSSPKANPPDSGPRHVASFVPDGDRRFPPRGLTLCSSRAGGPADIAAAILQVKFMAHPESGDGFDLVLVDLRSEWLGKIQSRVPLWTSPVIEGKPRPACIATIPGGRYLAVGGNTRNEINVYSTDDLLNGKSTPAQVLRSVGMDTRDVAFVRKGNRLGLALNSTEQDGPRELRADDRLFDFANRQWSETKSEWMMDTPPSDGWTIIYGSTGKDEQGRAQPPYLEVSRNQHVVERINFTRNEKITKFALLPPRPPLNIPIVAVAFLDKHQEPFLYFYDGESGEPLRQLTGHLTQIHSLAFSGNGKLLVSAAGDQTICFWSLTDLDQIWKKRGRLRGVAVDQQADGELVVAAVDEDSPYRGQIKKGDVIDGLVEDGRLQRFDSAQGFYCAIFYKTKPGDSVTLRIGGRDVKLVAGQGVDEQKPLASLFVSGSGDPEWIGWSPHGPYETSTPAAERMLGWHINTGNPDDPTSFASARQYHKSYYRPNILRYLVESGNYDEAIYAWEKDNPPPPPLKMVLQIFDGGQRAKELGDRLLLRNRPFSLKALLNRPVEGIQSWKWAIDKGMFQDFKMQPDPERSADLSALEWTRGPHRISVELRLEDAPPVIEHREVLYLPPAPNLECKLPGQDQWVGREALSPLVVRDEPKFRVEARARPKGQRVNFSLSHRHQTKELADPTRKVPGPALVQELRLLPGDNVIKIMALNDGAIAGYEEYESADVSLLVDFKKKVASPRVSLWLLPDGASQEIQLTPEKAQSVDVSNVRLRGRLEGAEELEQAARDNRPIAGFTAKQAKVFDFREMLNLTPGTQRVRLSAKSPNSAPTVLEFVIDYRPQLPTLKLTTPFDGITLRKGKDGPEFELKAELANPADPRPYQLEIWINEKKWPRRASIKGKAVSATLPLESRENRIAIRLSNQWGRNSSVSGLVRYLRPPRILKLEEPKVGEKPLVDIAGRVESELPLTTALLTVSPEKGREIQVRPSPALFESGRDSQPSWPIRVQKIPLERGRNTIRLIVGNDDGLSPEASVQVTYNPPPPPKATVAMLDPERNTQLRDSEVDVPHYRVRWKVQSKSRLSSVQLSHRHEGRIMDRKDGLEKSAELSEGDGVWDVHLGSGLNELQVDAVNDGGLQSASIRVSYVEKPVRVEIAGLELRKAQPGIVIHSELVRDGALVFEHASDALARLHGRVVWQDAKDRPATSGLTVRTWVNGFQQIPTTLQASNDRPNESTFQADIVLNRPQDNNILIKVPDLKEKKESLKRCLVRRCDNPITDQRLNLLIVGADAADKKQLLDRALAALGVEGLANMGTATRLKSDSIDKRKRPHGAFQSIGEVVVLTGKDADRYAVRDGFFTIRSAIEQGDPDRPINDVVVFYFQGREKIEPNSASLGGHFLLMNATDEDYRINCDQLAALFGESVGAQIILLDVSRQAPNQVGLLDPQSDRIKFWPLAGDETDLVAVFRSAWLGSAQVPSHLQLITVFQQAVSKFGVLDKIGKEISDRYTQIKDYPIRYDPHLPAELSNLKIGREATAEMEK